MGVFSSLGKAIEKGAAKKAARKEATAAAKANAAPKPPRQRYRDYKWDAGDYGMAALAPISVGFTATSEIYRRQMMQQRMDELALQRSQPMPSAAYGPSAPNRPVRKKTKKAKSSKR